MIFYDFFKFADHFGLEGVIVEIYPFAHATVRSPPGQHSAELPHIPPSLHQS